jgi:hypothetical protein
MTYRSSSIKRNRRTRADVHHIRKELVEIVSSIEPATVRQVFYQAVSRGLVEKSEAEYKQTICRLLTDMRLDGSLPFGSIADSTRWMRKPKTWSSAEDAIRRTAEAYRRSLWDDQDVYVEIWCEKDALAGVLYEVTAEFDVPLMVTRGYPSLSYLHDAAKTIAREEKPAFLYYFGDYDPSGVDISRNTEARLRQFAPDADITFTRVAVTWDQVLTLKLPTRPTKKSDVRSAKFAHESVELDAISPADLRSMVRECIEQHIDQDALEITQVAELSERQWLKMLAGMSPIDGQAGAA